MTRRINPFFLNMTRKNWTFLLFLIMTQRLEPSFEYDSQKWTFFYEKTRRIELLWIWFKEVSLFNMTQKVNFFFRTWLKEVNFFEHYSKNRTPFSRSDAKNWTFFSTCDTKNWTSFWIWFKELNFCLNYTTQSQRIEPSFFSLRLNESNTFFFSCDSCFQMI